MPPHPRCLGCGWVHVQECVQRLQVCASIRLCVWMSANCAYICVIFYSAAAANPLCTPACKRAGTMQSNFCPSHFGESTFSLSLSLSLSYHPHTPFLSLCSSFCHTVFLSPSSTPSLFLLLFREPPHLVVMDTVSLTMWGETVCRPWCLSALAIVDNNTTGKRSTALLSPGWHQSKRHHGRCVSLLR